MLVISLVAQASLAEDNRGGKNREPELQGANVETCPNDPEATCLHLTGTRLHRGKDLVVQLNGSELEIHLLDRRGRSVFVVLPEDMEPQIHVLQVMNGQGSATLEVLLPGTGVTAVAGYTVVHAFAALGSAAAACASCPEGFVIVGGGYDTDDVNGAVGAAILSFPVAPCPGKQGYGWQVSAENLAAPAPLTAYGICINPDEFGK